MKGLMMDYPLTLTQFFERTRRLFHRKTHGDAGARGGALALHLRRLRRPGVPAGRARCGGSACRRATASGTFAWNSHRHLEVYFAAPLMGMVLHTVNIRLSAQDITYIVNHAEDEVLIVDASLWPMLEPIRKDLTTVKHFDRHEGHAGRRRCRRARSTTRRSSPATAPVTEWPRLEETRRRRHVLHLRHHRAPQGRASTPTARIYLHCFASSTVDVLGICERDVILHIVPDVPRQRLVRAVRGRHERAPPRSSAGPIRSRATSSRSCTRRRSRWSARCPRCGSPSRASSRRSPSGTSPRSAASRSAARRRPGA